jgi:metal-sulfur cluster biosynthetic enzyme
LSVSGWLQDKPDVQMLQDLLHGVIDPEIGVNIVDLGLVYGIRVSSDGVALVRMTLTTPGCPLSAYMDDAVRGALWGAPGVSDVDLQIIWEPPWSTDMMSHRAKQELGWER